MDTSVNNPLQDNSTPSAVAHIHRRWHWTTWVVGLLILSVYVIINLGGDKNPDTNRTDYGLPWVYCEYRDTEYPGAFSPSSKTIESKTWYHFWPLVGNVFVGGVLIATSGCLWERRIRRLRGWLRFSMRDWLWLCVFFAAGYSWFASLYHDNRIWDEFVKRLEMNESQNKAVISDTIECRNGDIPFDWFWDFSNVRDEVRPFRIYSLSYEFGSDVDTETIKLLQTIPKLKRLTIIAQKVDEKWITALRDMPALEEIEFFSIKTQMRSSFFPTPGKGLNAEDEAKFREYFLSPAKTGTDDADRQP